MVESSILFSPEISERDLDREVDQVNESLQDAGQMDLQVDDSELQGLSPDGIGGMGGGGGLGGGGMGGATAAGGAAGLASRLPKPVAGLTMSSVLPVALGGAVGVGMLSQLKSSSGQLESTTSILGIALDNVLRPIGDAVADYIMPFAKSALEWSDTFGGIVRNKGLDVGIAWAATSALEGIGRAAGDAAASAFDSLMDIDLSELSWDDFVTAIEWVSILNPITWSNWFGGFAWSEWIEEMNWPDYLDPLTWPDYLKNLSWDDFANMLTWDNFVDALDWLTWLSPLKWNAFVVDMVWNDWLDGLDWGTFIPVNLDWGSFIPVDLDWDSFIPVDLDWDTFIPLDLDWGTFVPRINWGDFLPTDLFDGGDGGGGDGGGGAGCPAGMEPDGQGGCQPITRGPGECPPGEIPDGQGGCVPIGAGGDDGGGDVPTDDATGGGGGSGEEGLCPDGQVWDVATQQCVPAGPIGTAGAMSTGRSAGAQTTTAGSGGGGTGKEQVRKLDEVKREIQNLNRSLAELSIEVDKETLGRVTKDADKNRLQDTDPLA